MIGRKQILMMIIIIIAFASESTAELLQDNEYCQKNVSFYKYPEGSMWSINNIFPKNAYPNGNNTNEIESRFYYIRKELNKVVNDMNASFAGEFDYIRSSYNSSINDYSTDVRKEYNYLPHMGLHLKEIPNLGNILKRLQTYIAAFQILYVKELNSNSMEESNLKKFCIYMISAKYTALTIARQINSEKLRKLSNGKLKKFTQLHIKLNNSTISRRNEEFVIHSYLTYESRLRFHINNIVKCNRRRPQNLSHNPHNAVSSPYCRNWDRLKRGRNSGSKQIHSLSVSRSRSRSMSNKSKRIHRTKRSMSRLIQILSKPYAGSVL